MNFYEKELNAIKKANRFRERKLYDEELIDLGSNDYLGLASKEELFEKTCRKLKEFKTKSPKASQLVNGYSVIHKEFEQNLCQKNGFEEGVVVGSGFLSNISLIEALVRRKDILFMDEEYHASGILATKLTEGKVVYFKHNDYNDLEKKIKEQNSYNRIIIAIEGVYSMLGDIAPRQFDNIAQKYGAILLVDEAHSSGVIGEDLLGWFDHHNIKPRNYHIKMGTLGKAYGSYGSYILSTKHIITYLENRSKPIIYSTAPSLFDIALANEALNYMNIHKEKLKEDIRSRQRIVKDILNIRTDSLIVPVTVNDNKKVLQIQKELMQQGFIIGAIRQPTVKEAILRVIIKLDIEPKLLKKALLLIKQKGSF
jgi:8-amino-7-oxononanoate synthase